MFFATKQDYQSYPPLGGRCILFRDEAEAKSLVSGDEDSSRASSEITMEDLEKTHGNFLKHRKIQTAGLGKLLLAINSIILCFLGIWLLGIHFPHQAQGKCEQCPLKGDRLLL